LLAKPKAPEISGAFSSAYLAIRLNVVGICGGDPKVSSTLSDGHLHAVKIDCEEAGSLS